MRAGACASAASLGGRSSFNRLRELSPPRTSKAEEALRLSRPGNSLGSPRGGWVTMGKLKSKEWSRGRLVGLDIVEGGRGGRGQVVVTIDTQLGDWLSENGGSGDGGSDGREIGGSQGKDPRRREQSG